MSDKLTDSKREQFELLLKSGMDEIAAYEIAYDVSNEEANLAIKKEYYDYLVQSGVSEETAYKIIFEEDSINKNKTI